MTDTIPAPAPEHDEGCRHTDCVGECCEPCANVPKADPATKQPDGMTERERGAWEINEAWRGSFERAPVGVPWKQYHETQKHSALAAYDRAEQLFKAKADERVNAERRVGWEEAGKARNESRESAQRLAKERDAASRLAAEYKASLDHHMKVLADVQRERTAGYAERDGARAEVERLKTEVCSAEPVIEYFKGETERPKERDKLARKLEGAKAAETAGKQEAPGAAAQKTGGFCDACHDAEANWCAKCGRIRLPRASAEHTAAAVAKGRREMIRDLRAQCGPSLSSTVLEWLRHEAGK